MSVWRGNFEDSTNQPSLRPLPLNCPIKSSYLLVQDGGIPAVAIPINKMANFIFSVLIKWLSDWRTIYSDFEIYMKHRYWPHPSTETNIAFILFFVFKKAMVNTTNFAIGWFFIVKYGNFFWFLVRIL